MPGITGIIRTHPYEGIDHDLHLMVEAMRHEPHYSGGQYINRDVGLYVGWMCHQGAFDDCLPLVSSDRNTILIFHGEHYLDSDARHRIKRPPLAESNARYLLDLYKEFGNDFFRQLNGWYCGVIADLRAKTITLFNDRYGMARVYVHEAPDEFIFASEAKSLLKVRPALRALEPRSVAEHLRFNCVMDNRSLFRSVSLLPHGASWQFTNSALPAKRRYFDFHEWERQPSLPPAEFYRTFADTVSRVFPMYAESEEEVGFSLTAGLDTRVIMASLGGRNRSLPCYTFGGYWGELFDIRTARQLSKVYEQPFSTIRIDDRFLKDFAGYAQKAVYVSDGTHDAFGAHDVYFNASARDIAPIRLTGKFGSEVVRIRNLIPTMTYPPDFLRPDLTSLFYESPSFMHKDPDAHPLTRVLSQEIPWHESGRVAVEQSQVILRTPYMDNDLVKLMYRAPLALRAAGRLQERYVKETDPELSMFMTNMGRFASDNRLVTDALYTVLRALFKVEYIYLYATPHWLTRVDCGLERLKLERLLAGRQKWEGYRIWIKTHFSEFIRQMLLSPNAGFTDFFEKQTVENMVTRHIAGTHNYLNEINRALTIELIYSSLLSA
jgi:asparagine synthase (glutamine-hydrolysing)